MVEKGRAQRSVEEGGNGEVGMNKHVNAVEEGSTRRGKGTHGKEDAG